MLEFNYFHLSILLMCGVVFYTFLNTVRVITFSKFKSVCCWYLSSFLFKALRSMLNNQYKPWGSFKPSSSSEDWWLPKNISLPAERWTQRNAFLNMYWKPIQDSNSVQYFLKDVFYGKCQENLTKTVKKQRKHTLPFISPLTLCFVTLH